MLESPIYLGDADVFTKALHAVWVTATMSDAVAESATSE